MTGKNLENANNNEKNKTAEAIMQLQVEQELKEHFHEKPAIVLTGAHHAREHITIQTVLYTALNLIYHGLYRANEEHRQLLKQNKYYFIPSINVDGTAYIEE